MAERQDPNDSADHSAGGGDHRSGDQDQNWGRYVGIGLEMAIGVTLGVVVGGWLDRRYSWHGYGVLVGVGLGLAAGMYMLIKDAIRINKD